MDKIVTNAAKRSQNIMEVVKLIGPSHFSLYSCLLYLYLYLFSSHQHKLTLKFWTHGLGLSIDCKTGKIAGTNCKCFAQRWILVLQCNHRWKEERLENGDEVGKLKWREQQGMYWEKRSQYWWKEKDYENNNKEEDKISASADGGPRYRVCAR